MHVVLTFFSDNLFRPRAELQFLKQPLNFWLRNDLRPKRFTERSKNEKRLMHDLT